MNTVLPIGYFPPISYIAYLLRDEVRIEAKEHFVKQSLRNRCTILGANGPLHLLVPKQKSNIRQFMDASVIYNETDWKTLHWRSLESAYRKSPYFEFYEDDIHAFFQKQHTKHLALGIESTQLICGLLDIEFNVELTDEYVTEFDGLDLRNAWNKQEYAKNQPVESFESYIQVFSDRQKFIPDLSILDLLFCQGPRPVEYLKGLKLTK